MSNTAVIRSRPAIHWRRVARWWIQVSDAWHAVVGTALVMVPISPFFMPVIRRDSGVFLYAGWRILAGETLYRDIWDHKPPLILYLNALGLMLGRGQRWGVWILECLFLFLTILIGINLFKELFGRTPAILATYLWLLSLAGLISGGNYTTEYALPLLVACYWLYGRALKAGKNLWLYYWIGVLIGLAFFFKENNIGIGIAILIHLFSTRVASNQWKLLEINLVMLAGGAITVVAGIVLFFLYHQALLQFWDASFVYNSAYIVSSIMDRVMAVASGFLYLNGMALLAILGWCLVLLILLKKIRLVVAPSSHAMNLLTLGFINLPVELILLAASGNSYRHYYLTLLPVFALFSSFIFWIVMTQLADPGMPRKVKQYAQGFLAILFVVSILSAGIALTSDITFPARRSVNTSEVIDYIEQHTRDEDYVLLWGAETSFNFATQRRSPSRFSYLYPLYMKGYTDEHIVEEFLVDVNKNKPALIIDTNSSQAPLFQFPVTSTQIDRLTKALQQNYTPVDQLGSWTVYKYTGSPN